MTLTTRIKEVADSLAVPFFNLAGCRPWAPGYYTAKKRAICAAVDGQTMIQGDQLPPLFGCGIDERVVEYPWMFSQLPNRGAKMLDAGSSLNHGFLLDRLPLDRIHLTIMTLAPERRCSWSRAVSYVYGDLRQPEFAERSFDIVVSISTIEHIGLNNTLFYTGDPSKNEMDTSGFVPAVKEFRRVLKPGGLCLITVPYGRREICEWYQVFDAALVQKVVDVFQPSESQIDYFAYSHNGWQRAKADEVADAVFHDVNKSPRVAPDNAAAARGVACLRLLA
jgi:SAM-dependent methyltransferase